MLRELAPGVALRPWVECFWMRPAFDAAAGVTHRVLPDGCADILISLDDGTASIVGTMTAPLLLTQRRSPAYLGIRFRPGRALSILGIPLRQVTDAMLPLRDAWGANDLGEEVAAARVEERLAVIERTLLRRLARNGAERDRRVELAVDRLLTSNVSVDRAAHEANISRQHLRRRFLDHVGVGPKTFARVARFRRVVSSLRALPPSWAAVAADFGYADQSHLIAEFQQLAGVTPVPFFLSRDAT
jgi:AraC-like DNA-binding protein